MNTLCTTYHIPDRGVRGESSTWNFLYRGVRVRGESSMHYLPNCDLWVRVRGEG